MQEIVLNRMDREASAEWIRKETETEISEPDRHRFVEVAEAELDALHQGNIARYRLRPSEFEEWRKGGSPPQGMPQRTEEAGSCWQNRPKPVRQCRFAGK